MFWADHIAQEALERFQGKRPLLIRDEKTASGRVHVGSVRGVAIHGTVSEALTSTGAENIFIYEINDFDPMDDIPDYLDKTLFEKYLGMPLRAIPSPDGKAANFAEYFGSEFCEVITKAGWSPTFTRGSELYLSGKMNEVIREALDGAAEIRRIYKEISGSQREDTWLPINMVCPQCGKISTTRADEFDGTTVHFICKENAVEWTQGCGFEGRTSPFDGGAKLPWKVEWPAKWKVYGVDIEGGGKDHSTKGGSRDAANHISRDVFHHEPPFDVPYEFFLVGGKKMSSSKGRGSSAKEISELLPTKIFRLALLSKDINQAINFDPEGDTIPTLYDLYDKLAERFKAGIKDDYARLFTFTHTKEEREHLEVPFLPRFSQVAFIVQMPHMNLEDEVALLKGELLNEPDKKELRERAEYAKRWLDQYAPEKFVFKLQESLPESATALSDKQKAALKELAHYMESQPELTGESLHTELHDLRARHELEPSELFGAIYTVLLGKSQGPKAGWFLSVLPRELLLERLKEAAK
jgi:lysyl-tRNA synthetase, class I